MNEEWKTNQERRMIFDYVLFWIYRSQSGNLSMISFFLMVHTNLEKILLCQLPLVRALAFCRWFADDDNNFSAASLLEVTMNLAANFEAIQQDCLFLNKLETKCMYAHSNSQRQADNVRTVNRFGQNV